MSQSLGPYAAEVAVPRAARHAALRESGEFPTCGGVVCVSGKLRLRLTEALLASTRFEVKAELEIWRTMMMLEA